MQKPPEAPNINVAPTVKPPTTPLRGTAAKAARALRVMSNARPTQTQLEQYRLLKDEMLQATRKHGSMHFVRRETGNRVGLINQGATCYLNSLLQSLFMTREFRAAVYGWTYDPKKHGERANCIPYQLQALFARLQLSCQGAVSTKGLTQSFGWSGADAFTQHDVQELTCVLFDALEKSDRDRFVKINALWQGTQNLFIQPLELTAPDQRHVKREQFLDIQVPVEGMGTLRAGLEEVVATETLSGDNQWFCEELEAKVDAKRGTSFETLPVFLSLHLMRFQFDMRLLRRVKVLDAMSFPPSIDLSFLLDQQQQSGSGSGDDQGGGADAGCEYELVSILMHSGSADRGHYYAYIKDTAPAVSVNEGGGGSAVWHCFNDACVHRLDEKEVRAIFSGKKEEEEGKGDEKAETSVGEDTTTTTSTTTASTTSTTSGHEVGEAGSSLSPSPPVAATEQAAALAKPQFAESAPASAASLDPTGAPAPSGDAAAAGAAAAAPAAAAPAGSGAPPSVVGNAHASASNAYLLVYRRVDRNEAASAPQITAGTTADSTSTSTSTTSTSTSGRAIQQGESGGTDVDVQVPSWLREEVEEENAKWEELFACHELHREMVELVVYPPSANTAPPPPPPSSSSSSSGFGGGSLEKEPKAVLHLHQSTPFDEATKLAWEAVSELLSQRAAQNDSDDNPAEAAPNQEAQNPYPKEDGGASEEGGGGEDSGRAAAPAFSLPSLEWCRLRRFTPHLRRPGQTFGHATTTTTAATVGPDSGGGAGSEETGLQAAFAAAAEVTEAEKTGAAGAAGAEQQPPCRVKSLQELGFGAHANLLLEARDPSDFPEYEEGSGILPPPWPEFNPNDMGLKVTFWDPAESCPSVAPGDTFDVVAIGENAATVAAAKAAVASKLVASGRWEKLGLGPPPPELAALAPSSATPAAAPSADASRSLAPAAEVQAAAALIAAAKQLSRGPSEGGGDGQAGGGQEESALCAAEGATASEGEGSAVSESAKALRRVVLVRVIGGEAYVLEDDLKVLRRDFDVWPGEGLLLELDRTGLPPPHPDAPQDHDEEAGQGGGEPPVSSSSSGFESDVVATYDAAHNTITVLFNDPVAAPSPSSALASTSPDAASPSSGSGGGGGSGAVYCVTAKRSETLFSVKSSAVALLNTLREEGSAPGPPPGGDVEEVGGLQEGAGSTNSAGATTTTTTTTTTAPAAPSDEVLVGGEAESKGSAAEAAASLKTAGSGTDSTSTSGGVSSDAVERKLLRVEELHCRRGGPKGTLLKDERKSLRALGMVEGSAVWLCPGAPCKPHEFLLEFVRYDPHAKPSFSPLFASAVAVHEASKISAVKAMLASKLTASEQPPAAAQEEGAAAGATASGGAVAGAEAAAAMDPRCLRLRDKKLSSAGSILRDNATVRRSLMNLVDGRQVCVQVLQSPETVGPEDMVITVKGFKPSVKKFTQAVEVVVSKHQSLASLRALLTDRFGEKLLAETAQKAGPETEPSAPAATATTTTTTATEGAETSDAAAAKGASNEGGDEEDEEGGGEDALEVAKGLANGPPLSAAGAMSLKWDDPRWCADPACELSQAPVSLRDGSLLYLRSRNDGRRAARVAAKAKAGTAKPKSKFGKRQAPWQSSSSGGGGSSSSSGGRSERGIHIAVSSVGSEPSGSDGAQSSSSSSSSSSKSAPPSPRTKLAKTMKVPLESASFALEAAGGDEALARSFLMSEVG